jgi:hypothetical protein
VLYDVSSTYFEGRTCELAQYGHNRDGKHGKLQIVFGLLCSQDGCPVAIEVFEGNVGDPLTLQTQIAKLKERFDLDRVVLVGDRGMITEARIRQDVKPADLDFITALRAPAIRKLVDAGELQPSLFDKRDLAEITSLDYPGERLVVCRNPLLAEERARKRRELLAATEEKLRKIQARVRRAKRSLRGCDAIGIAVGKIINHYKMAKHFDITITDNDLIVERRSQPIDDEALLDGIYVVRTNVTADLLDSSSVVCAYKGLSNAERAFRSLKTIDIEIRPIHHRRPRRVRAHVLLCMLAYYLEWHAPGAQAHPVRRSRQAGGRSGPCLHRRQGSALRSRHAKGQDPSHRRRSAGAQLPIPDRRSRHLHPQHHGDGRQLADLSALSKAHPRSGASLPVARCIDRLVASTAGQRVEVNGALVRGFRAGIADHMRHVCGVA